MLLSGCEGLDHVIPSGAPNEGNGGPDPPTTFQKVGSRHSHKNLMKLVGGGGGRGRADLSRSGL